MSNVGLVLALFGAALASAIWLLGTTMTLALLAAAILPALVVMRGMALKRPFFEQMRVGVIAYGLGLVAGMLIASRVGSANTTAGDAYFLKSYAAVYIGCTVSRKGVPNVPGTLVGAAILGTLTNGLTMLQMPTYMQDILTGAIIVLAVILQRLGRKDN